MLKEGEGIGCASLFAGFNIFLMGLVGFSFAQGPYSSFEQEAWYRYMSLGFLIFGALIPALILWRSRRIPIVVKATTVWMVFALILFVGYVMYSSGGV